MTTQTPPPGAIIPARIRDIYLSLPKDMWLMRGQEANGLSEEWESRSLNNYHAENSPWESPLADSWADNSLVVARRRTKKVTVRAQPGDRVVVLDAEALDHVAALVFATYRNSDEWHRAKAKFVAALDNVIEVQP